MALGFSIFSVVFAQSISAGSWSASETL